MNSDYFINFWLSNIIFGEQKSIKYRKANARTFDMKITIETVFLHDNNYYLNDMNYLN